MALRRPADGQSRVSETPSRKRSSLVLAALARVKMSAAPVLLEAATSSASLWVPLGTAASSASLWVPLVAAASSHLSGYPWGWQWHPECYTEAVMLSPPSSAPEAKPAHGGRLSSLGVEDGAVQTKLDLQLPQLRASRTKESDPTGLAPSHTSRAPCLLLSPLNITPFCT